jgi:methylmalonyl-CoA mutase N-terminal domain/subunit
MLESLSKAAAAGNVNMMPFVLDCVRAYATLGEICDTLRAVYGTYEEPTI